MQGQCFMHIHEHLVEKNLNFIQLTLSVYLTRKKLSCILLAILKAQVVEFKCKVEKT